MKTIVKTRADLIDFIADNIPDRAVQRRIIEFPMKVFVLGRFDFTLKPKAIKTRRKKTSKDRKNTMWKWSRAKVSVQDDTRVILDQSTNSQLNDQLWKHLGRPIIVALEPRDTDEPRKLVGVRLHNEAINRKGKLLHTAAWVIGQVEKTDIPWSYYVGSNSGVDPVEDGDIPEVSERMAREAQMKTCSLKIQ